MQLRSLGISISNDIFETESVPGIENQDDLKDSESADGKCR